MERLLYSKPIGTFVYPNDYIASRNCLERMIQCHHQQHHHHGSTTGGYRQPRKNSVQESVDVSLWTTTINTALQLLERNVKEYSMLLALPKMNDTASVSETNQKNSSMNNPSVVWFSRIQTINTIYNCWKDFALLHSSHLSNRPHQHRPSLMNHNNATSNRPTMDGAAVLLSPRQLVQSLEQMSILLPHHFHYDIATMNILLTVLIQQAPTKQVAPIIGEQLLDFIRANESNTTHTQYTDNGNNDEQHGNTNPFHMIPNADTYAIVIQAWLKSGLPETTAKVNQLLKEFHGTVADKSASPTTTTTTTSSSSLSSFSNENMNMNDATTANHPSKYVNRNEEANPLSPYMMVMKHYSTQNTSSSKKVKDIYNMIEENKMLQSHMNVDHLSHILSCITVRPVDYDFIDHIFTRLTQLLMTTRYNMQVNTNLSNQQNNNMNNMNHQHYRNTGPTAQLNTSFLLNPKAWNVLLKATEQLMRFYRDRITHIPKLHDEHRADCLRRSEYVHECVEQLFQSDDENTCTYEGVHLQL